jgi:hypothetical protein
MGTGIQPFQGGPVEEHVKNQSAFLTASTVREWIARLQVEKFISNKGNQISMQKAPASRIRDEEESSSGFAVAPTPYSTSSGEDYDEFLKLMQQGKRPFRKPGITVRQEYELWLAARAKARNASSATRQIA